MKTKTIPGSIPGNHFEKIARIACAFQKFTYFCCVLHDSQRAKLANKAGIFYARLHRFRTPLRCVNAPAAGYSVGQRVGTEPFYLHIVQLS